MNSTAHGVLENLKAFFVSFPPEQDHKDLAEHHFTLHKAVLTLRNFSHASSLTSSASPLDMLSSRSGTSTQSLKIQRKGRSQSYAGSGKWYRDQGSEVFTNAQDVTQLEADLLKELKQIMQVYFYLLTFATDGLSYLGLFFSLNETILPSTCKNPTFTWLGSSHFDEFSEKTLHEQAPFKN
jgi:hypothetical protein